MGFGSILEAMGIGTNQTTQGEEPGDRTGWDPPMNNHLKRLRSLRSALGLSAAAVVVGSMALSGVAGATTSVTNTGAANNIIVGAGSSTTYPMMQALDTLYNTALGCTMVVDFASSSAQQPLDYSCLNASTVTNGHNIGAVTATVGQTPNPYNDVAVEEPPVGSSTGILQLENNVAGINFKSSANYPAAANVVAPNFVRSSRSLSSSTDQKGLNAVAYAADGVDWVHYANVNGVASNSTVPGNILTQAELQGIYNGTITNWNQLGGSKSAPIIVFSAQEGSGTQSTWKGYAGSTIAADPSALTNKVNCFNVTGLNFNAAQNSTNCSGPIDIFENETAQLALSSLPASLTNPATATGFNTAAAITQTSTLAKTATAPTSLTTPSACSQWVWGCTAGHVTSAAGTVVNTKVYSQIYTLASPTADQIKSDAIFFYSSGLFNHQCVVSGAKDNTATSCAAGTYDLGSPVTAAGVTTNPTLGKSKYTFALGRIGGAATAGSASFGANSGCSISTIAGVTDVCFPTQGSVLAGVFPNTRKVYNIYSDGANTLFPAATPATLNYVSETGFLCSPATVTETDPLTGLSYRSEINSSILSSGFYPLSAGQTQGVVNQTAFAETGLSVIARNVPGVSTSPYAAFLAPTATDNATGAPMGFCATSTMDVLGK